ncbi:MAG: hypothetical protein P8M26_07465 [Gammaproteobacteria bacterium]|nr:hypothetical protein [Gammaproteobacteria bacterium]
MHQSWSAIVEGAIKKLSPAELAVLTQPQQEFTANTGAGDVADASGERMGDVIDAIGYVLLKLDYLL